jgi:hypothetical protein
MLFDNKKKEFKKNGKLSILKTKSMKMDYPNNIHLNDNDIFQVRKNTEKNPKTKLAKEDTVEKIIRVNLNNVGNLTLFQWYKE